MTGRNRRSPFIDLSNALGREPEFGNPSLRHEVAIRVDPHRQQRTGIPEVVFAAGKSAEDVAAALRELAHANGRALASRVSGDQLNVIGALLEPEFTSEVHALARAVVASRPGARCPGMGGKVGVISAGTSDIPIGSEAALMAAEMGATVAVAWDVGIAGLHRLVAPLERLATEGVDVIVVAAGMDGALPAVVSGLIDVPVIGVPTSVGYGLGGGGIGALTTMLQSCAPGLVVVNIDNGIGAGAAAALIANRAAESRYITPGEGSG